MVPNNYSTYWYETFLDSIPVESTQVESAFIERHLPVDEFPRILDLCCGPGRHASALSKLGYHIHGVDMNERAIREARVNCPDGFFEVLDMRSLDSVAEPCDAVVNLWHSFGYFDEQTNLDVLRQVCDTLRPGGRAIFDIFNRDHAVKLPADERSERGGRRFRTRRSWSGKRHRVSIEYDDSGRDEFEWRLYSPGEFTELCLEAGLHTVVSCACFDEAQSPSAEHARMQFVEVRAV